jgi:hypothetical protein
MSAAIVTGMVGTVSDPESPKVCNIPASKAGDLILIVARPNEASTFVSLGGFTLMYQGDSRTCVFYKVAVGNEGLTTSFNTSGMQFANFLAYCISDWGGDSTKHLAFSGTTGIGNSPNAPTLALPASFSPYEDVLFINAFGAPANAGGLQDFPATYTSNRIVSGVMGFAALCSRVASAAVEYPDAAKIGSSVVWVAVTIAVAGRSATSGSNLFFGSNF